MISISRTLEQIKPDKLPLTKQTAPHEDYFILAELWWHLIGS